MKQTPQPRPAIGPLLRLTACCCLATGTLLLPAGAAAVDTSAIAVHAGTGTEIPADTGALPAPAKTSTVLRTTVTDDAGLLDDNDAQKVVERIEDDHNLTVWIVTIADTSMTAEDFAKQAWKDSALGTYSAILVINVPGNDINTYYFGADTATNAPLTDEQQKEITAGLKPFLSDHDFDGAVAALPDLIRSALGSGDSAPSADSPSSALTTLAVGGAAAAAVAGGAWAFSRSRRKNHGAQAAGTGPAGAPPPEATLTLDELRTGAGNALVAADDAVRAADEELSYAQAQFGLSATDSFTAALKEARAHLARSFELRKLLDDDIPDTEQQQRSMYGEIIQRCQAAMEAIRAQEQQFNERRGIEADLPSSIAETSQRADETEQAIAMAETLLVTLHATYPETALTSVSQAPGQARRLLEAGRTALDQAHASLAAGQQGTAVEQVRIAQGSIAQAGELTTQVTGARERLEHAAADLEAAIASISSDLVDARRLRNQVPSLTLDPLVNEAEQAVAQGRAASGPAATGDPLAALDRLGRAEAAIDAALAPARAKEENDSRARAAVGSRLARLNSQVDAVTSYITTHRGAVGAQARTALSEASRHAAAATALQGTDAAAALAEVTAGEPLVSQAQALAEADVRNSGGFGSSYGSGGSGGGFGGLDLGSLILGGILLGGGGGGRGGYGGWGSGHRGGGWGSDHRGGGWNPGHRGGGFGGGGGGGLGGGGDRF
ncbi:TPM domain-containing protein [Actinomyces oricola]